MRSSPRARSLLATVVLVLAPVLALASPVRAGPPPSAHVASGHWVWPLLPIPRVVRFFEPPDSPYGPGHRGVDLAGVVGQPVLAIGDGTVAFAGSLAGEGVVVVDHGGLRSTYQPVGATVRVGASVAAGQQVGLLELVHSHCLPDACLHLGVLRGDRYLDPLTLLAPRPVVLKPLTGGAGNQFAETLGMPLMPRPPRLPRPPRPPRPMGGDPATRGFALPTDIGTPWEVNG